ncbi:hypothetical protein CBER1_05420 [Cercospora berteroae]|uniref:Uncharacterized protein n=1 Tax=Cercospora berteroae TaxID=357750 RepID=A0A2S6C620_9PEZI|nr:hypothetical protein CBER1_05420 [Cercospora berteroae]
MLSRSLLLWGLFTITCRCTSLQYFNTTLSTVTSDSAETTSSADWRYIAPYATHRRYVWTLATWRGVNSAVSFVTVGTVFVGFDPAASTASTTTIFHSEYRNMSVELWTRTETNSEGTVTATATDLSGREITLAYPTAYNTIDAGVTWAVLTASNSDGSACCCYNRVSTSPPTPIVSPAPNTAADVDDPQGLKYTLTYLFRDNAYNIPNEQLQFPLPAAVTDAPVCTADLCFNKGGGIPRTHISVGTTQSYLLATTTTTLTGIGNQFQVLPTPLLPPKTLAVVAAPTIPIITDRPNTDAESHGEDEPATPIPQGPDDVSLHGPVPQLQPHKSALLPSPTPITFNSVTLQPQASAVIVEGQTLALGSALTLGSGPLATTVALHKSDSSIILQVNDMVSTLQLLPTPASALADHHLPPSFTIGSQVITANSKSEYIIQGETLAPGSRIVIAGSTMSLAPNAQALVINGKTQTQVAAAHITPAPKLTIGSMVYSIDHSSRFVLEDHTLQPGGPPIVLDGGKSTVSLASNGAEVVVNGKTTNLQPNGAAASITVGSKIYTTNTDGNYSIDGRTLAPGGSAVIADGTTLSMGSQGRYIVVDSSSSVGSRLKGISIWWNLGLTLTFLFVILAR